MGCLPCFRSIKSSTMPDCSGPGRNKATRAIISSRESGCRRRIRSFMPRDSSWNTAVVSAFLSMSNDGTSSSGISLMSRAVPPCLSRRGLIIFRAQSMMVRVRSPRKSNFTRPASSTSPLSNWVTRLPPSSSQYSGEKSVILVGAITTPPACLPAFRHTPSSFRAISQISWASSSFSRNSTSCGSCSSAFSRVMPGSKGIILESLSASPYDLP